MAEPERLTPSVESVDDAVLDALAELLAACVLVDLEDEAQEREREAPGTAT